MNLDNFTELFSAEVIAQYWTEANSNRAPYLGAGFFPSKKKAGLDLSWIKGRKGLPITLMPSTFDAKACFRDRIGVSKVETEMPFFREGFLVKEKDRQDILRAQDSKDPYVEAVLSRIFDDAANLIEGAAVVPERMRMQLLAPVGGVPSITLQANGVDYTYNYDPDGAYQANNYMELTGNDRWSDTANSKPLEDLREAMDTHEERTGTRPEIALMSRATLTNLVRNDSVKSAVLAQNVTANILVTDQVVRNIFSQLLGLSIAVYTKKYIDDNKATQSFYPDGFVSLLPNRPVGSTWYGTTPEEADLQSGGTNATVRIVDTGVAVTVVKEAHPVNIATYASEIVLPSYENMDDVYVMKVS